MNAGNLAEFLGLKKEKSRQISATAGAGRFSGIAVVIMQKVN